MEKKQNLRTNQVPAKVLTSDSRKSNQDASGKQLPRNLRRRECSSNYSQNQKNERPTNGGYRQQQQQQQLQHIFTPKSRGIDKRIRLRNDGYQRDVGTTATSSTGLNEYDDRNGCDEIEAELNSVYLPGSKKQNLNHLLNFNYAPRERNDPAMYMRSGNISKGHNYVKRVKYNKEQFLQANCQFVVKSTGDYTPCTLSPDLLVEWSHIEQIHIFGSTEEPQCPICLYHPVAAKMTRCGHVYCWPCILHYLALSDKKSWRKCPICYEAVHIGDLKSAVAKPHRNYNCDEFVTFQLMCRSKDSLKVTKAGPLPFPNQSSQFPSLMDDPEKTLHSKLLLANAKEIMSIIERERNELKCQLTSDGIDCPDSIFVQQALHLLDEREQGIYIKVDNVDNVPVEPAAQVAAAIENLSLNANAKEFIPGDANDSVECDEATSGCDTNSMPTDDIDFIIDEESNLTVGDINIVSINNNSLNANNFYFYQSRDGQNLYLHSINVRMLQTMYGSLENAPKSITGKIVQKEACSMSEDLRKRLKYLQHLPVSCQFDVVEIQLDQPVISIEIQSKFRDELLQRQKTRQRRAREERKREKHIDLVNDRQIGKIIRSAINIDVTSDQQFPMFDDPPLASAIELSTSVGSSGSSTAAYAGPSFAKMLTSPRQAELWPTLGRPKESPAFATADFQPLQSNRNQIVTTKSIAIGNANDHSDNESVDFAEEACAPPEFKNSFGSAIAEALNNSAHMKPAQNGNQSINLRGKKKKNNGKMVLFSTGGRTFDGN